MLIPLKQLIEKYNIAPKGVIHVGGSHAEEFESYMENYIYRQLWIEPIPEVFEKMQKKISVNPLAIGINTCITDKPYQNVTLKVSNNDGQSSSIFDFKKHKEFYPTIDFVRTIECTTLTLDEIVSENNSNEYFNSLNYNFLNIDIQGAELLALKGSKNLLKHINYVYCEVNTDELYQGCPHVTEIDAFLTQYGFVGKDCIITDANWGDKFYIKEA